MKLTLPLDSGHLIVEARILRFREGIGMGLRFINLTEKQLAAIKMFLEGTHPSPEGQPGRGFPLSSRLPAVLSE